MKGRNINITTKEHYLKEMAYLESLAKKGEKNLSEEEVEYMRTAAEAVEAYEDKNEMGEGFVTGTGFGAKSHHPDLIEIVEFKMFQRKMTQAKLADLLQQPASKVSQILNKKREPDVAFLKAIHEKLEIDGNFILESI